MSINNFIQINATSVLMKTLIAFSILLSVPKFSFGQFPIGKNMTIAVTELKQLMKTKGFTFLRTQSNEKNTSIDFSEELSIILVKNYYDNVSTINISTFKKGIMDRLKITFDFPSWEYVGKMKNSANEEEPVYRYKGYKIRMPEDSGIYQFIVSSSDYSQD